MLVMPGYFGPIDPAAGNRVRRYGGGWSRRWTLWEYGPTYTTHLGKSRVVVAFPLTSSSSNPCIVKGMSSAIECKNRADWTPFIYGELPDRELCILCPPSLLVSGQVAVLEDSVQTRTVLSLSLSRVARADYI